MGVSALGSDPKNRILGRGAKAPNGARILDNTQLIIHPEVDRVSDLLAKRTKQDVIAQIKIIYGQGGQGLSENECTAVAALTFNMGLDPSPGVGHIYAWKKDGKLCVQIGYTGFLFKAKQEHDFVYEVRRMHPGEYEEHGLNPATAIGCVCELYDRAKAKQWQNMGMVPKPIRGIGVALKNETPPRRRTMQWVAEKSATVDALRHLGLGFGPLSTHNVPDGFQLDAGTNVYSMPAESEGDFSLFEDDVEAAPAVIETAAHAPYDGLPPRPWEPKELPAAIDHFIGLATPNLKNPAGLIDDKARNKLRNTLFKLLTDAGLSDELTGDAANAIRKDVQRYLLGVESTAEVTRCKLSGFASWKEDWDMAVEETALLLKAMELTPAQ